MLSDSVHKAVLQPEIHQTVGKGQVLSGRAEGEGTAEKES